MDNRFGRNFLNAPGPTNVPERVLRAMHRPAVDLVDKDLNIVIRSCFEDLKKISKTVDGESFIFAANGHGAWEAGLVNVLSPGDKVLVCDSGQFSEGWAKMATALGAEIEHLTINWREALDPAVLEERLRQDDAGEIKAVMTVQIDTGSGITSDIAGFRKAMDAANHPALLLCDTVASLATMDFRMDEWGVDLVVGGGQKGLMQPPGLSFNIASPKAMGANQSAQMPRNYWDWGIRRGPQYYMWFAGTAPEHLVWAMREGMDMLEEEGPENTFLRHRQMAAAVQACIEIWAGAGELSLNATIPEQRAVSVTPVRVDEKYDPVAFRHMCREQFNVGIAGGLGELNGKGFRIGHMGYMNAPMLLGALASLEMALKVHGVPHEKGGVLAAMEVLSAD